MEKETPYEKLKRETDELETDKLNRIDKGMYEASGGTPTECPDCKCTNLVSDQCKGECLCHHPELTPTEEWENCKVCGIPLKSEDGLVSCPAHSFGERKDTETSTGEWEKEFEAEFIVSYFMSDGAKNTVKSFIRSLLTSHDAKWQQHEHDMYESLEKAHKEELAELARKIEGMKRDPHNDELTSSDVFVHNEALDAVLALLSTKK